MMLLDRDIIWIWIWIWIIDEFFNKIASTMFPFSCLSSLFDLFDWLLVPSHWFPLFHERILEVYSITSKNISAGSLTLSIPNSQNTQLGCIWNVLWVVIVSIHWVPNIWVLNAVHSVPFYSHEGLLGSIEWLNEERCRQYRRRSKINSKLQQWSIHEQLWLVI